MQSCDELKDGGLIPIVLKAITIVVQPPPPHSTTDSEVLPNELLQKLSDDIIIEGFHKVTLETLQALIILSIAEYGSSRLGEFYNLISVCKRSVKYPRQTTAY